VSPLVIVLIVLAAVVMAAGIGFAAVAALRPATVDLHYSVGAGSTVVADVADARMRFHPSGDGRVHVAVSGWSGPRPSFTVRTAAGQTRIEGGCPTFWFVPCSLSVDVSVPSTVDLAVTGANGDVSASGLDGPLQIGTTNGAVDVSGASGALDLRSVNGAIRVTGSSSRDVKAVTTNGAVDLRFLRAPDSVQGRTTNGSVLVRVPGTQGYRVVARTVNGRIDTGDVVNNPDAPRTITVDTVNGSVTVERSAG
jgi:hypothetical protein